MKKGEENMNATQIVMSDDAAKDIRSRMRMQRIVAEQIQLEKVAAQEQAKRDAAEAKERRKAEHEAATKAVDNKRRHVQVIEMEDTDAKNQASEIAFGSLTVALADEGGWAASGRTRVCVTDEKGTKHYSKDRALFLVLEEMQKLSAEQEA